MGKSPPSMMSPDKLNRLVEIFSNHGGTAALDLSPNAQSESSRAVGGTMMPISWRKRLQR